VGCHGANAQGGVGPKLAGESPPFDRFVRTVRSGRDAMPAFTASQVSDAELQQIYDYLRSLR
jgi:cytochrome c550